MYNQQSFMTNILSVPVSWLKEPKDVRYNVGDDFTLECTADGIPKPNVMWITSRGFDYNHNHYSSLF
jgi:hypothetical protein